LALQAAHGASSRIRGFFGREAAPLELLLEQSKVRSDLAPHFALSRSPAEQVRRP
jgi:hypothetical protein